MATEFGKLMCGACHHPAEDHVGGKCCKAGCYCTARFGEPEPKRGPLSPPSIDELAEECSDLEEDVARLTAAAQSDTTRINKLTAEVALLTERAADLRKMLEGERMRAELFKDERDQWRHAAGQLAERALGEVHPDGFTLAMFKVAAKAIAERIDRAMIPAKPDLAEFLALEAARHERNQLRIFMAYLKIAAEAKADEDAAAEFRTIMSFYQRHGVTS